MEYPSGGVLYLDGHHAVSIPRQSEKPINVRYRPVSESSKAPFLFSPLVVTGEKPILLLELIMDANR